MVRLHRLEGRRFAAAILVAGLCFCASVAATPQRVLVIHSFGRDIEPYAAIESVFRTSLARSAQRPVVIHETTVDAGQALGPTATRRTIRSRRAPCRGCRAYFVAA